VNWGIASLKRAYTFLGFEGMRWRKLGESSEAWRRGAEKPARGQQRGSY